MIKKIFYGMLLVSAILVLVYLFAVYKNNRSISDIDEDELDQYLEKSIVWLVENKKKIIKNNNPMLWWMVYEAHKVSSDERLSDLLGAYYEKNSLIKRSLWGPLFGGEKTTYIRSGDLLGFPYYNLHFIYALNCASNLEYDAPVVEQQNKAGFCFQTSYIYRPACVTHQLMGLNFIRNQSCENKDEVKPVIDALQNTITNQLTWDIRVVDVYLQRVMMLLITGQDKKVKPVWVRQILDHQLEDGGWGDFDKLISLWDGKSLGLSQKIISINSERSTFHATAQGVYILTMLLYSK